MFDGLDLPDDAVKERSHTAAARRAGSVTEASDADALVLARQLATARPLSEREMARAVVVDTEAGMSPAEVARLCKPLASMPGMSRSA